MLNNINKVFNPLLKIESIFLFFLTVEPLVNQLSSGKADGISLWA